MGLSFLKVSQNAAGLVEHPYEEVKKDLQGVYSLNPGNDSAWVVH